MLNSNSPHSPFLWVILRLDFVGRNSNPSSFQGLSNFAEPGIPKGFTSSTVSAREVEGSLLLEEEPTVPAPPKGVGTRKADADASVDRSSAE